MKALILILIAISQQQVVTDTYPENIEACSSLLYTTEAMFLEAGCDYDITLDYLSQ